MMFRSTLVSFLTLAALATTAMAQHGREIRQRQTTAPDGASQFEFLVGQWEIVAEPRVEGLAARIHGNPKLPGTWKAWRALDGWGIEDELRLTDASGNPRALTHAVRVYDATARQWKVSSLDVYRSSFQTATAEWRDGEMRVDARGTDVQGRAFVSRSRFHDITANGFRLQQDRSYDDGRTWTEGFLKVEAKRVAAVAPR
jgi:hypothetical protein